MLTDEALIADTHSISLILSLKGTVLSFKVMDII